LPRVGCAQSFFYKKFNNLVIFFHKSFLKWQNSWFWILFTIFQLIKIITFWGYSSPFSPLEKSGKKKPHCGYIDFSNSGRQQSKFKISKNIFFKKINWVKLYIQVSKNSNPGQVMLQRLCKVINLGKGKRNSWKFALFIQ
jgi:hypothetical protein